MVAAQLCSEFDSRTVLNSLCDTQIVVSGPDPKPYLTPRCNVYMNYCLFKKIKIKVDSQVPLLLRSFCVCFVATYQIFAKTTPLVGKRPLLKKDFTD